MSRPIILIHGYSAGGLDFKPLCQKFTDKGVAAIDLNVANYVSLNNEITIKDIAEGFDRAIRNHPRLKDETEEFDAIVHSTGMLVLRSWLTNYSAAVGSNTRLKRLKHLIGLAPATWGSPQAHKGRTWIGALVKGNREPGPDFMNAGDEVLDGLELGSRFTWDLTHMDLLGDKPYYGTGPDTPYVCVFIGNTPYTGISSVANDPGTDGTVRWSGAGLNTRKITIDLTRTPIGGDGKPVNRVSITPWEGRIDVPILAVDGRNHATLVSDPDDDMVKRILDFVKISDENGYNKWLEAAREHSTPGLQKMLINPGKGAGGLEGQAKQFFEHLFNTVEDEMDGWQQFVMHARDEHGDPVTDYLVDVLQGGKELTEMYTDVHAYGADPSFRCFHIRLPKGISKGNVPLQIRIAASTGTALIAYQGYGSDDDMKILTADAKPVVIEVNGIGDASLFFPFTTTLVEIVLNREPAPLNAVSGIFKFLEESVQQ